MKKWAPDSWLDYPYLQSVDYRDKDHLNQVVLKMSAFPPLVSHGEIIKLKSQIALAGRGKAFILQGGDCAESFHECLSDIIGNKLKILLQMSLILIHGMNKPIIRIGRIAGQYAKPRSSDFETINGVTLPSYRGDLVNMPQFDKSSREPNPDNLLQGYGCAAMTLNYIRALLEGGFADLAHHHQWDLDFVENTEQAKIYHEIVHSIDDSMRFLKAINGLSSSSLNKVDFFTSHEALHLHYEQALTRHVDGDWYNLSTHFPWVGMRTAQIDGAHVHYLSGINNPIGLKIGPLVEPSLVVDLIKQLNPNCEEGRIVLITRLGASQIDDKLPALIHAVQKSGVPVTWSSDPMHGNTETTNDGIKTRHFDNILSELTKAMHIHQQHNSYLGGVHFELTGENVTECIGGARNLTPPDLKKAYTSLVDPRLNYEQSLEMAIQIARFCKKMNSQL